MIVSAFWHYDSSTITMQPEKGGGQTKELVIGVTNEGSRRRTALRFNFEAFPDETAVRQTGAS